MTTKKLFKSLFLIVSLSVPLLSEGIEFKTVHMDKSKLSFAYQQMGVGMEGAFKKFAVQLNFDPAKPTRAQVVMDVVLASIDTGSAESDSEVASKLWFNTQAFPIAHFVSSRIKPLGGNRYTVTGPLTIKGRTQPVTAMTTVMIQGNHASFDGAFVINRTDFAIGEGLWADLGTVADEIQIKFHLLASDGK